MTHHHIVFWDSCMLAGSLVLAVIKATRQQGLLLFAAFAFILGSAIYVEGPYDPRWQHLLNSLGMAFVMASIVLTSFKWFTRPSKERA